MTIRIANGAGFLGDQLDAPRRLVESASIDYLTLEYLAELTMSILARLREKNPDFGYARDFLTVLKSLIPSLRNQSQLKIVTNAGGVNPPACVRETARILVAAGLGSCRIASVTGDDILGQINALQNTGWPFLNVDTGEPLANVPGEIVSAHAYVGALPIAKALTGDARIVITGRVADASLTVGPCLARFHWPSNDWERLAGGSVAGHLIECGSQVTGGYSTRWQGMEFADIGYPIAEIDDDGSCVITKPTNSTGLVDFLSVAQQLVYEIGDPRHYLTPDVDVDFTTVQLREIGPNQVSVTGARGAAPPDTLKVSMAYRAGFMSSGQLLVTGNDCVSKAKTCADTIRRRLERAGFHFDHFHGECLGAAEPERAGQGIVAVAEPAEVMLRIAVRHAEQDAVERFSREFAPLITSGPAGLAGYAAGRPTVTPVFGYWPTTVPRDAVLQTVELRTADEWSKG